MDNTNNLPTSPDWSTAPDWAMWFAISDYGEMFFFEKKPYVGPWGWHFKGGRALFIGYKYGIKNWKNTLQKRPDNE